MDSSAWVYLIITYKVLFKHGNIKFSLHENMWENKIKALTHKWLGDPTHAWGEPAPTGTLVSTMVKTIVGHEHGPARLSR
jgi:hypothetical protein